MDKNLRTNKKFWFVCCCCDISRPILRKWWQRYQENGVESLNRQSKQPHHIPNTKLTEDIEILILDLRKSRNLGAKCLQSELLRNYDISLSVRFNRLFTLFNLFRIKFSKLNIPITNKLISNKNTFFHHN